MEVTLVQRRPFQLGVVQMRVVGGELRRNVDRAEESILEAADLGAEVVLLPEAFDVGWTHPSAKAGGDRIPGGQVVAKLCAAAKSAGVYVCSGITERAGSGALFNAALLVDPGGEILIHHRKIYELSIAHDLYSRGDRLVVAKTPLATFGVMICADAFAPGLCIGRALGLMGAEVILSPCAWAVDGAHDNRRDPYGELWLDSYRPVAEEFRLWIAAASNVGALDAGPWAGKKCIGNSMVVAPGGDVMWTGPHGKSAECTEVVRIEPEPNLRMGEDPGR